MKTNLGKLSILFTCMLKLSGVWAQNSLPVVMPPSPDAQAFHKYGEYPVANYTGVPDISVPIYEIKSGELSLPISIRFHASGFKTYDVDGVLGLNWSINAGGMVSRQIKGMPDDYSAAGYFFAPMKYNSTNIESLSPADAYDQLLDINNGTRDAEYDLFSYSAGSSSGSFVIKGTNSGGVYSGTPMLLDDKKIERVTAGISTNQYAAFESFDVVNENGQRYHFGKSLVDNQPAIERSDNSNAVTSWLLTEIISADLLDTIRFSYNPLGYLTQSIPGYTTSMTYFMGGNGIPPTNNYTTNVSASGSTRTYRTRTLNEISFRGGKMKFTYNTAGRLINVVVLNNDSANIRNVDFSTSAYDPSKPLHYKLDNLLINGKEKYQFNYFNTPLATGGELSEDWWGYYNGSYYPGSMTPYTTWDNGFIMGTSVSREPNESMMNYMINKITYPTAGYTEFEYEVNKYKQDGVLKNAGGLRVSRIVSSNGLGSTLIKHYKYGENEDGAGNVILPPTRNNLATHSGTFNWVLGNAYNVDTYNMTITMLNYVPVLANFGSPVYYKEVAEYQENIQDNSVVDNGRIVCKYEGLPTYRLGPFADVGCLYFNAAFPVNSFYQPYVMPAHEEEIYGADQYGRLLDKTIYRREVSGYVPVRKETNSYFSAPLTAAINLYIYRTAYHSSGSGVFNGERAFAIGPSNRSVSFYPGSMPPPMVYRNVEYISTRTTLQSQTVTEYSASGNIENTINYTYAENHGFPIGISKLRSDGKTDQVDYYRSLDVIPNTTSAMQEAYNAMASKNMIGPVVLEIHTVNDYNKENHIVGITMKQTVYKKWDVPGNIIKPSELITTIKYTPLSKVLFSQYDDRGNLSEVCKEYDNKISYIWGYRKQYPIAEINGASVSEVAYLNFDENTGSEGKWKTQSGAPVEFYSDQNAPMGKYCIKIPATASNSRLEAQGLGLTTGKEYIVSFWEKGGSPGLSGGGTVISNQVLRTSNGWSLREIRFNYQSGNVTLSAGVGQVAYLNELRLYPASAQMITYTYKPLIGVTAKCDVNNLVTYYEYDSMGRLTIIRDKDKFIIKRICYNYAGQPEDCN